ncbi:MAG: secretin N-terminal domain-containing protein [Rubripirellula sp.]|nr:secretin N-terminal domain-containing protein [Rubripirellula sp.]
MNWQLALKKLFCCTVALIGILMMPMVLHAQAEGEEVIELNLSGPTSLTRLVEAVSRQLNVRYLYSADLANRQVTVYTPARFPKKALPALLGSLLKGENLAIVDSEVEGWKRIVDIADIVPQATPGEATEILARDGPAGVVTQVVSIRNANITTLASMLRPFLSKGGNFIVLPENRMIIVTDYAGNVKTVIELLKLIDQPAGQAVIEFYETKNRTPATLIEQVESLLSGGNATKGATPADDYKLFNDASGRRVVVAGLIDRVDRIMGLLARLDTGMDFQTRVYRIQNVPVQRIDRLIRGLVSQEESEASIETTVDEDGNLLIVRAPAEVHQQVETLLKEIDRPVDSAESPIRFYKLKNANAIEVLYSLLALQQAAGSGQFAGGGLGFGAFGTLGGMNVGGVNPASALGLTGGVVPAGMGLGYRGDTNRQVVRMPFDSGSGDGTQTNSFSENQNAALSPLIGQQGVVAGMGVGGLGGVGGVGGVGLGGGGQVAMLPGGARVSADVATNSLIVYAPASIQPLYEKLIRSLDQRRPQVMIEAQIVAVDTTDNFSLGVEVSTGDRTGSSRLFKFTSFGLSQVDPTSGRLTPIPDLGFNGVLLDPEVADVIVQALTTHARSRLLASPKILVNDNQTGKLESVASVPFRSINTINTISSESLGGDQEAGTIVTVTPHINEDDHLQLEFEVEFSTFTGQGDPNLPPPRQIDRVRSAVTIPDGKTVVVGGLKRIGQTDSFSGVPWVEKVPVLRELTRLTTEAETTTSFFLFIRPKILRDSRFRDLRYLSDIELNEARIPGDFPTSQPLAIPCLKLPTQTVIHPINPLP